MARTTCLVGLAGLTVVNAGVGGLFLPGTQPNDGTGDPAFPEFMNGRNPGILKETAEKWKEVLNDKFGLRINAITMPEERFEPVGGLGQPVRMPR